MADTAGSLVDKLATVNNKMFWNQEFLFEIRDMDFEAFSKMCESDESRSDLLDKLKKVVDLNFQRQALILEFDKKLTEMILELQAVGKDATAKYVVDQHKTAK